MSQSALSSGQGSSGQGSGEVKKPWLRPIKLRHILFALLLASGIIPLVISAYQLISTNKEIIKTQQTELLTQGAQSFAGLLSDDLRRHRDQLRQFGRGLLAPPERGSVADRLHRPWVVPYLSEFGSSHHGLQDLRVLDSSGSGLRSSQEPFNESVEEAMTSAFNEARETQKVVYRFAVAQLPKIGTRPTVAVAVPIVSDSAAKVPDDELLVVEALVLLPLRSSTGMDLQESFLVDDKGRILWTAGENAALDEALLESDLVQNFLKNPFSIAREAELEVGGQTYRILARVVPVDETGWGVVAHRTADEAFNQVQAMIKGTLITSVGVVALAFFFAYLATLWLSNPIQQLADISHQIAAGNFDRRVPPGGLTYEVVELGEDFNRMSEYVERYVDQLKQAAKANRQLFISSIRAFAAAIDAKDPYTRGHSERVARFSRAISHYLGQPKDMQEKVWISAVLHDIGKIGVEDRVLLKMGQLTDEEFGLMKQHPVIGADIVEPILALREMLPGIRWHHEAWNGSGYPDQLKGEQIPLMARIIGVADTFDAITTNRPYQKASPPDYAIQIIKKLTGTKFDAKIVTAFLLAYEAGHIGLDPDPYAGQARPEPPPAGAPSSLAAN